MTDNAAKEAAWRALLEIRGEEAGGCFRPADEPKEDCHYEAYCWCVRQCKKEASAALAAYDEARFGEDVVERCARAMWRWGHDESFERGDSIDREIYLKDVKAVLKELGIIE